MIDDLKAVFQEIKPEMLAFLAAVVVSALKLIAEPEAGRTKWGQFSEVLLCGFMAMSIASLLRVFHLDHNLATFIGTCVGIIGFKATRLIVLFFFKNQLK